MQFTDKLSSRASGKICLRLFFLLGFSTSVSAEQLLIAAAADLKFALDEIVAEFKQAHQAADIAVMYGSSGKFYSQIRLGAPFHLYFSADLHYAKQLAADGFASSEVIPYAIGRLVLWQAKSDVNKLTLDILHHTSTRFIAIANPKHAPYGKAAIQALEAQGWLPQLQAKLVYGESVAQAAHFVQSGNAEFGIIARSLALHPELTAQGRHLLIPSSWHQPLLQGFIITNKAAGHTLSRQFALYMQGAAAKAVLQRYGFELPDAKSSSLPAQLSLLPHAGGAHAE